eukprot:g2055.t1
MKGYGAISVVVATLSIMMYYYFNFYNVKISEQSRVTKIFDPEELQKYSGVGVKSNGKDTPKRPLYLAVLGKVFDVTRGRSFYGEGGGYDFFTGIDGTRAFVSGNFTKEGLIDDIDDFDDEQLLGVDHWLQFYESKSEGKYFLVGYLIGRYYDSNGNPTPVLNNIVKRLKIAVIRKENKKKYRTIVPSCNSHWEQGKGTLYSCDDPDRSPMEEFFAGTKESRCACIKSDYPLEGEDILNGELVTHKIYKGCQPNAPTCHLP